MTENATIDREAFVGSAREIRTAGLNSEGWYLYEFVQCKPKHSAGISQKTGQPYDFYTINYLLRAHEYAEYEPIIGDNGEPTGKGTLVERRKLDPKPTMFKDFKIEGKGLKGLQSAYRAITGALPTGETVDKLSMAEEIRGQKAWGRVFWATDAETERVSDIITNDFRSIQYGPPATAQLPRG